MKKLELIYRQCTHKLVLMKKFFFSHVSIKTQLAILFFSVLLFSFVIGSFVIYFGFSKNAEKQIGEIGLHTISALESNLNIIFENVTQFSNVIFFDNGVQEALKNSKPNHIFPEDLSKVQTTLSTMLLSASFISAAVLIDLDGGYYKSYKAGPLFVDPQRIYETDCYIRLMGLGNGLFVHGSENILDFPSRPNSSYITYIRTIPDKYTYENLAFLLLVIDEITIQNMFSLNTPDITAAFCILDASEDYVISPKRDSDLSYAIFRSIDDLKGDRFSYQSVRFGGMNGIVVRKTIDMLQDWNVVGFFPMGARPANKQFFRFVLITFAIANVLMVSAYIVLLHRRIFKPLLKIQNHLQLVEEGIFIPMEIESGRHNEIITLQKVNNHMICSVRDLIKEIKNEEKIIAQKNLDIICAQMNPHFLYNTLDAASALCLVKDTNNCYRLLRALGSFYRSNLNSGKDVVSVAEEIENIKSYVTILNIRYAGKIQVHYDIEESILELPMLKLVLQPIVENAIYHGIKEQDGLGCISIKAYRDKSFIFFEIFDNGVGMDENKISTVMQGRNTNDKNGFGLYSLIQRVSLYYCLSSPVTIESKKNCGTKVVVKIKVMVET